MGCLLYTYEDKLSEFGIIDPNFSLSNKIKLLSDGRELFKIFSKKYFLVLKTHLDFLMKQEREHNTIKEQEVLLTLMPEKLFKNFQDTYDIVKKTRIKQLYEFFLIDIKEIILNYVLATDYIINVIL